MGQLVHLSSLAGSPVPDPSHFPDPVRYAREEARDLIERCGLTPAAIAQAINLACAGSYVDRALVERWLVGSGHPRHHHLVALRLLAGDLAIGLD